MTNPFVKLKTSVKEELSKNLHSQLYVSKFIYTLDYLEYLVPILIIQYNLLSFLHNQL